MRNVRPGVKIGLLVLVMACGIAAPRAASAALSLRMGSGIPDPALCAPGQHSLDLIFTETGSTENEGLFAYDLLLVVPTAVRDVVRLDGIEAGTGPGFVLGDDPNKYTFTVAESDANHVLANIASNNDLFDITTGKRAASLTYTVIPPVPIAVGIVFDPAATVFGSGDPYRLELSIAVDLTDSFALCPEPGGLALVGISGAFALRRGPRRR